MSKQDELPLTPEEKLQEGIRLYKAGHALLDQAEELERGSPPWIHFVDQAKKEYSPASRIAPEGGSSKSIGEMARRVTLVQVRSILIDHFGYTKQKAGRQVIEWVRE